MIELDLQNMYAKRLGSGISTGDIDLVREVFFDNRERFYRDHSSLGFTNLPYAYAELEQYLSKIEKIAEGLNTIVVIGIGGSDLGMRAIHTALNSKFSNEVGGSKRKLYFTGDTTDPNAIKDLVEVLDLKDTLFLVVSKSGNTIEQASSFLFFRDLVNQTLGDGSDLKHFVFLTDPEKGILKELAVEHSYQTFNIPADVGGRFSVLSSVGMVPAHLLGLNVKGFLDGARELDEFLKNITYADDFVMQYVAVQYMYYRNNRNISILMPYIYSLSDFAKWYCQLWAESLGKANNDKNQKVNFGITPVAALGPVDQHSQLQLYNEGPLDKVITFIVSKESKVDVNLPQKTFKQYEYLDNKKLSDLLEYEYMGTVYSLTKNARPNATITLPRLDEYHLGQLFYFFEVAVTYMGYILRVNPFDQPGVEESKNAVYGMLGKPGYEEIGEEVKDFFKK